MLASGRPAVPRRRCSVGLAAVAGYGAEDDRDLAATGPAERAGARQQRLVGLGAQHRVEDERPGRAGASQARAPRRRGRRTDGGGRERTLRASSRTAACTSGTSAVSSSSSNVGLDDVDGEPQDQVDGLLEVDDAGQGPGRGAEHGRDHLVAAGCRAVAGLAVPDDELADTRLTIMPTRSGRSAGSSRNQGRSCSIRAIAEVLSAQERRCSDVGGPLVVSRAGGESPWKASGTSRQADRSV